MTRMRGFFVALFALCAGTSHAAGQQNAELDRLVLFATARTAAVPALFDSVASAARRDSGTARADSTALRFRRNAPVVFDAIETELHDQSFELAINPDGAVAFRRARSPAGVGARDSLRSVLRGRGVWAFGAEGSMYYVLNLSLMLDRLGRFVTPPVRAYLEMDVIEQRRPSAEDGGFMVPRDEIIDRIAMAERYLETYPQVPLTKWVAYNRDRYVTWLLYPSDNFVAFDHQSGALLPEARRAMERLASGRSAFASGKAAHAMLDLLKASGYRRTPTIEAVIRDKWNTLHDVNRGRLP